MIRRNIADGDLACFTTWSPKGTTTQELVNVEGTRWRIEECFETAKNEFGLDHNETRSWHGWHRHVSLVMLAYAVMASVTIIVVRWSIQEIRRLVVKLAQRRLPVLHILRWSVFRRTHQASAIRAHSRHKMQL
ncbi:transposase [Gluconobacter oxydans H24]|nr:transposase [Gluconobacter oxydans H24]